MFGVVRFRFARLWPLPVFLACLSLLLPWKAQALAGTVPTLAEAENNRIICDLSGAFEADNGISHYSRKVDAQWENNRIIISEKAEFEGRKNLTINFYTPIAPEKISSNKLHIGDVELSFSGIEFIHAEKSEKLDAKLTGLWGALWEIRLGKTAENHAEWLIEFTGK